MQHAVVNVKRRGQQQGNNQLYGVPDAQHGELPVAEVVPKPSVTLTQEELLTFCAERLSAYKVPVRITFVEELERTYNGKIARKRSAVRA